MQLAEAAEKPHVLGVILAGGRASRMGGGDKALLELGEGQTMLDAVIARLGPQVDGLALNANGDPARFARFGLPVLADPVPDYPGPLAGLLAGLDWAARAGASHIVTAAADTPFLPADLVARLSRAAHDAGAPLALAETDTGLHPTFGLWPVGLGDTVRTALEAGKRRLGVFALDAGAVRVSFGEGQRPDPFFNVNTPEDLAIARTLLAGGAA